MAKATVKVRSTGTGEALELSASEAQEAFARGTVELEDDEVRVVSGDNQSGTVSRADLGEALAQGWKLASEAEAEAKTLRREASGVVGTAQGSVEAVARGASLGLSDVAIDALGGDAKAMRARQEALGDAGTALEVGGAIGASVLTGGGGAVAQGVGRGTAMGTAKALARRGLGAVGAPTRYSMRAGDAVAGAIVGAETGLGRQVVSRVAGGGVDGALGGLGGVVSESVLTEKDLTAEALLGGLAAGAIFGGALEGGASAGFGGLARGAGAATAATRRAGSAAYEGLSRGASAATTATRKVFGDLAQGVGATTDMVRKILSRETGIPENALPDEVVANATKDPGWLETWFARSAALSGADPTIAKQAISLVQSNPKRVQDVLNRKGQIEAEIGETLQARLETVQQSLAEARQRAQGEAKYASLAGKLPPQADTISVRLSDDLRKTVRTRIDAWKATNTQSGHLAYDAASLVELDKLWTRLETESILPGETTRVRDAKGRFVKKALESVDGDRAMARYRAWDRFKRDLDLLIDKTGGWGAPKEGKGLDELAINQELRHAHREIRDHLEREDLWGQAAVHQRELNGSYARSARASAEFQKIATGSGLRGLFDPSAPITLRQSLTVARQFRRMGGSEVVTKFDEVLDRQLEHLDTIMAHYDLGRAEMRSIQAAKDAVKDIRERMAAQAEDAEILDVFQSLRDAESNASVSMGMASTVGPAIGAAVGAGVAGPIGAAAGIVAGGVLRPYTTARTLASLMAMKEKFAKNFDAKAFVAQLGEHASKAKAKLEELTREVRTKAKAKLEELEWDARRTLSKAQARVERAGRQAAAVARRTGRGFAIGGAFEEGRQGRFRTTSERQRELVRLADRVSELGTYENLRRELGPEWEVLAADMPELAAEFEKVLQRAVAYLDQHRPPIHRRAYSGRPPIVDPVAAARFERRYEAVTQPERVLSRLRGGTLALEHVDALRSVYPLHYQGLVDGLIEALVEADEKGMAPSHRDRVRLGIVLGQPLDVALEPAHRLAMGRVYGAGTGETSPQPGAPQPGAPQPGAPVRAGKVRAAGVDRMSFDRLDTPAAVTASGRLRA